MIAIDGYIIDVAVKEEHGFENEITEHPVEQGADIVDHVRARPIVVTLEGVVSDTPVQDFVRASRTAALPSREALDRLLAIRNARQPVEIVTSIRTYTDMMLESLTVPRDAATGDALAFTARFRQIRIVTTQRAVVDIPRAKGKTNRGQVTVGEAEIEEPPERRKSLLKRGVNRIGELF